MKAGTIYRDKKTNNKLVLLSQALKYNIEEKFVGLTEIVITDYRNFFDLKENKVVVRNLYELEEVKRQYTKEERETFLAKCRLMGISLSSEEEEKHINIKDLKAFDCIFLSSSTSVLFRSLLYYHAPFAVADKYLLRKEPDGSFSLLIGYKDYLFCTLPVKEIKRLQFAVKYGHLYGRIVKEPKWKSYKYKVDKEYEKRIVDELIEAYSQYLYRIEKEDDFYKKRVLYSAKKCNIEWVREQFIKSFLPDFLSYIKARKSNKVFLEPEDGEPFYVKATLTKESIDLLVNRLCKALDWKLGGISARCNLGIFYLKKGIIKEENGSYHINKRVYATMSDLLENEFSMEQTKEKRLKLFQEHIYDFLMERVWS